MKTNLNECVPFETAKRLAELGYSPRYHYDAAYALADYTHYYWIGGRKAIKAGDWVTEDEFGGAPDDSLLPSPTYAEAIDWLVEHGFMDMDWDFVKAVEEAVK